MNLNHSTMRQPRGFGEQTRGLSGEYVHEQGWQLNQNERVHMSGKREEFFGGNDMDYGSAQDFGDEAVQKPAPDEERPPRRAT